MTRPDYFKAWEWKCDICIESGKLGESIFLSENALKSHVLLKHPEKKEFKCPPRYKQPKVSTEHFEDKVQTCEPHEDPLGDLSSDTPKATVDLQEIPEKLEREAEDLAKRATKDSNISKQRRPSIGMNPLNTGPTGQYEVEDSPETLQNIMRVTRDQESVFKVIRILSIDTYYPNVYNSTPMFIKT